jgi:heat shock protein HtpX
MAFAKRIFLFLAVNILVVLTLSFILNLLGIRPYLTAYGLDLRSLMIFCLIWGMGGAFISLSLSRVMAKWMMGVRVVDPNTKDPELQKLLQTIRTLSNRAGLPAMPEVGVYESPEFNAFATGPTRRRSLVAVSSGLLNRMPQDELEGVLAHEISHIANGDMVTMTLLQGVVNAFVMFLARVLAYVVSGLGNKNRSESSGGSYITYMLLVFAFEVVFMILGSLVIAAYSRRREYRADYGGARLSGKEKMISALEFLKKGQQIEDKRTHKPAFDSMKISGGKKSGLVALFSTHPPLDERIARLRTSVTQG